MQYTRQGRNHGGLRSSSQHQGLFSEPQGKLLPSGTMAIFFSRSQPIINQAKTGGWYSHSSCMMTGDIGSCLQKPNIIITPATVQSEELNSLPQQEPRGSSQSPPSAFIHM